MVHGARCSHWINVEAALPLTRPLLLGCWPAQAHGGAHVPREKNQDSEAMCLRSRRGHLMRQHSQAVSHASKLPPTLRVSTSSISRYGAGSMEGPGLFQAGTGLKPTMLLMSMACWIFLAAGRKSPAGRAEVRGAGTVPARTSVKPCTLPSTSLSISRAQKFGAATVVWAPSVSHLAANGCKQCL